jgi:hypothetical protein
MLRKASRVKQIGQIYRVGASWFAIFCVKIPAHNRFSGVSTGDQ